MDRTRRRLLAGVGTAAAAGISGLAGCAGVLGSGKEWKLRAMRADPDSTDHVCELSAAFVDAHPTLAKLLSRADETPQREWTDDVLLTAEQGNQLGADLREHCGDSFRGLYLYEGTYYFVSLIDRYPENDKGHANGGGDGHDGHNHSH